LINQKQYKTAMVDLFDKVQAIWSALDKMSEEDPAGYQTFIQEQLSEGSQLLSNLGREENEATTTAPGPASTSAPSSSSAASTEGRRTSTSVKGTEVKNLKPKPLLLDDEIGAGGSSLISSIVARQEEASKGEQETTPSLDLFSLTDGSANKKKKETTKKLIQEL